MLDLRDVISVPGARLPFERELDPGRLAAPYKKWYSFGESAHSPIFEEPEKWTQAVTEALGESGI